MLALAPLALALAVAAPDAAPRTFAVGPGSTLTYRLVHRLHSVHGVSREIEGRARLLPGGGVQVMIRAPIASFDSGNGNRDANMREATDAGHHPFVQLKAVGDGATAPASFPAAQEVLLRGELQFHGRTRPVAVPAKVTFESPDRARVEATFPVSLEAYGVERPSLLFVKVEDRVDVEAKLRLEAER